MTEQDNDPKPRASVRRSLAISLLQKNTSFLIVLPTFVILSRLLTPAQIGVYSVAAAFVSLIHMLRDFGVSEFLVQENGLDEAVTHAAFTVNLIVAWILALFLFFASSWIGGFYHKTGLGLVLQILSINFVFLPFISTVNALLQRSMQFGVLYKINVTQQLAQSITTILLAALGYGYFSPAWGSVGGIAVGVLGCSIWGGQHVSRKVTLKDWRRVAKFGVKQTIGTIIWRLGVSAPDFVIGRMLGFSEVGFYSRGFSVVKMFRENIIGAIRPVAFSAYARDHRESANAHLLFLRSLTYISGICWPFFIFSGLMAHPIIRIMFGEQWNTSIPILRLLSVAAALSIVTAQEGQFLTAVGRVGLSSSLTAVIETLRICSLFAASFYSLQAVAIAQVVIEGIKVIVVCFVYTRYTAINWSDLAKAFWPSAVVAVATLFGMVSVDLLVQPLKYGLLIPLSATALMGFMSWVAALRYTRHPLGVEILHLATRALALLRR